MFVILLLILPETAAFAAISTENESPNPSNESENELYYVYSEEDNVDVDKESTIPVYSSDIEDEDSVLANLPLFTQIEIIQPEEISEETQQSEFHHVRFLNELDKENAEFIEGYVKKEFVFSEEELVEITTIPSSDAEEVESNTGNEEQAEDITSDEQEEIPSQEESDSTEEETGVTENNVSEEEPSTDTEDAEIVDETEEEDNPTENDAQATKARTFSSFAAQPFSTTSTANQTTYRGVALQNTTNVYESRSTSSKVLKGYTQGSNLIYRSDSGDWYEATVYLNGKPHTGYIHKNHVEHKVDKQEQLEGVAKNSPTRVYKSVSTSSGVWKSYSVGSILKYRTFSENWYQATVYVNGKRQTGYIHKNHVENAVAKQESLEGVAKNNPTRVYRNASTSAAVWKSYSAGSILKYRTYSSDWYQATVYVNGKRQTGYIHKNHVENAVAKQENLEGIARNNPTRVYRNASTSSSAWKSYSAGSILKYRTYSSNWYQATVYVNGKRQTGYIHKNHVENAVAKQETLNGVALNSPTRVYKSASTSAATWRSYSVGSILKYRTYSTNWYQATVYISGKPQTGYIHKNHVENATKKQQTVTMYAAKRPTPAYITASRSSRVLKNYGIGNTLRLRTFSNNWYQATVYVNGVKHTAYFHRNDVSVEPIRQVNTTSYNRSFTSFVDIQASSSPKADGAGRVAASRNLVAYYANPSNTPDGSNGFYQFLDLTSPAGLNAKEVNQKILNNVGTLSGTASAFIEAGRTHGINEAYLIAHALHETGNGNSTLARGVKVNGRTVYNMYGVAAYDDSAVTDGAKYAYDKGWFTPEAAIIGGAEFIGRNYIHRSPNQQNTLYKMRWNPERPGTHQYATHVAWATITANRIATIYEGVDEFVAVFDVPRFQNQPGYDGPNPPPNVIDFPSNIIGETTGTNVNLRSGPGTSHDIITSIPNSGAKLEIMETNGGGWYRARYNGNVGWISADYVKTINLIEVTASGLNVRQGPGTSHSTVGSVSNGRLLAGVLDSNDNLVTNNEWYQVHFNGGKYWVSSGSNHGYLKIR